MKYFLFISLIASIDSATMVLNQKHLPTPKDGEPQKKQPIPMPVQGSEKARFIYREFLSNREDKFIIQATKCNPAAKNELWIERFDSQQKVVDGEVNTIHIYARAGDCDTSEMNSIWSETIQIPKSKKMTHVYITILSSNVMVL